MAQGVEGKGGAYLEKKKYFAHEGEGKGRKISEGTLGEWRRVKTYVLNLARLIFSDGDHYARYCDT